MIPRGGRSRDRDDVVQVRGEVFHDRCPDWYISVTMKLFRFNLEITRLTVGRASQTASSDTITDVLRSVRVAPLYAQAHKVLGLPMDVGGGEGLVDETTSVGFAALDGRAAMTCSTLGGPPLCRGTGPGKCPAPKTRGDERIWMSRRSGAFFTKRDAETC